MTQRVLEVSVHIAAEPETVFAYFTDPARYVQWMGNYATSSRHPGGPTACGCATEWRPPDSSSRSTRRTGSCSPGAGPRATRSHPDPPGSSSPSTRDGAAPTSYCATTTCPTTNSAGTTAGLGHVPEPPRRTTTRRRPRPRPQRVTRSRLDGLDDPQPSSAGDERVNTDQLDGKSPRPTHSERPSPPRALTTATATRKATATPRANRTTSRTIRTARRPALTAATLDPTASTAVAAKTAGAAGPTRRRLTPGYSAPDAPRRCARPASTHSAQGQITHIPGSQVRALPAPLPAEARGLTRRSAGRPREPPPSRPRDPPEGSGRQPRTLVEHLSQVRGPHAR